MGIHLTQNGSSWRTRFGPRPVSWPVAKARRVSFDSWLAPLLIRQFGIVARWQLRDLGVPKSTIRNHLARHAWFEVDDGVYAVGSPSMTESARLLAAVLAAGPEAALYRHHAAHLHGPRKTWRTPPEVIVPPHVRIERNGLHRVEHDTGDITTVNNIPVTTLARAIADLAAGELGTRQLELLLNTAEHQGVLDFAATRAAAHGQPALLKLLDRWDPSCMTQLAGENSALFMQIIDDFDLPVPQLEVIYRSWTLDAFYPDLMLAIELNDRTHMRRDRFERDHDLASALARDRIQLQPFNARQLAHERDDVAETMARVIAGARQSRV